MTDSPILITGGAGFIGSCLAKQLVLTAAQNVIVLDKLTYAGNLDSLEEIKNHELYKFIEGDICDSDLVTDILVKHNPRGIINLAAESHVDRSIDGPALFVQTNVVGTCNLLDSCFQYWRDQPAATQEQFRFLHVSTDEVYGSLVRAYHHTFGLPVLTTNCSNNYGPFQFPEKLIPLMISKAVQREPLPIYGDGSNIRDWLHVEDHCRALRTVFNQGEPGRVYNIGGNSERTNLEIVHAICDIVDKLNKQEHCSRELITFVTDRPGHDQRYAIDCSRLSTELNWQPQYQFESGLEQTIDWYLQNSPWTKRVMDGSYRGQRLGKHQ